MTGTVLSSTSHPNPVRVAHVMAGAPSGGAELFFERLCAAQVASGEIVKALIRRNPERLVRLANDRVDTESFRFGGRCDLFTRRRVSRSLHAFAPSVTVAWMSRAARFLPSGPWVPAGRLGGYYDLSNYRRCRHLIGNTRGLTRWMVEQGWAPERVHYLPNFAAELADVSPQRPEFLPTGQRFVLALGRLHRNKAFDVLIRAMAHVPDATLVIAGEGPERDALETLARKEGVADRVYLPGWIHHGGAWLKACDLLVCPSRIEPLGNVVIEAFSAGRPVVAADIQGPHELIAGTRDGLLAPVEDDKALACRIRDVLGSPTLATELGRNGRTRYEREFSAPTVLARWAHFLRHEAV